MTHLTPITSSKIEFSLIPVKQLKKVLLLNGEGVSMSIVTEYKNQQESMFNRVLLVILLGFLFSYSIQARSAEEQDSLCFNQTEAYITFRVASAILENNFDGNAERLQYIVTHLQNTLADSTLSITAVEFSGMASPEGDSDTNHSLSQQRMQQLERYIRSHVRIPDSIVSSLDKQVAWQYLDSMVINSDMPYRHRVSAIIQNTPIYIRKDGEIVDGRKKQLMDLNNGRTWYEMNTRFFPAMRNACAVVVTYQKTTPRTITLAAQLPALAAETPYTSTVQEPVMEHQPMVETTAKPHYMALKTNALLDVLAIPSIGFEIYLGKKWSVATNWHYAWWKSDPNSWYWRTYGGDIALRRWFGRKAAEKPLTGHHIGIYGQILTYDFETGGRGYLGDRWSYAAGIEYGYSLPIAKQFNIDFTLGGGYLTGEYKEYLPMDDCYVWQATKERHWVGPTKAEISIVWLLGRGNTNKRRGGKR